MLLRDALAAVGRFWNVYHRLILTSLAAAFLAATTTFVFVRPPRWNDLAYAIALLPVLLGLAVGFSRMNGMSDLVQGSAKWAHRLRQKSVGHPGRFRRWIVAPVLKAPELVELLAGKHADKHVVSGISIVVQLYTILVVAIATYFILLVVVTVVISIAAIALGLWVLGKMLSDESDADRSPGPVSAVRTRAKKDIWGDEYQEHRDDRGRKVGESREKRDFWGEKSTESRDVDGQVVERTRPREDFWGEEFQEHRDSDGRVVGKSREKEDLWGDRYQERRDSDGNVESTSEDREDFWGDRYTERKPKT